jgi:hypothetical protein
LRQNEVLYLSSAQIVADPDITPFSGYVRVGGDSPETPKFAALALDSSLGDS